MRTETPSPPKPGIRPNDEDRRVAEWRVRQLRRLGVPDSIADRFAGQVDWHEIAALVEEGCPADLALEIVR